MEVQTDIDGDARNTPVVRIKLPWTFIFGGCVALASILIVMWSSVNRLTDEVRELSTVVKTGNQIIGAIQLDVGVLKQQANNTEARLQRHLESPSRRDN